MHTLEAHQAAAALKAALIGFHLVMSTREFSPTAIVVTISVDDDQDPEASFEAFTGNHPYTGGSL